MLPRDMITTKRVTMKSKLFYRLLILIAVIALLLLGLKVKGQCFQVYDGFGIPQTAPYFISCSGNDYTVFIQTDIDLGNYSINWGDGSPVTTGSSLIFPNYISHLYSAVIDTFIITITDHSNGCTVNGVVVLEEPVNASIQIPMGGVTTICAPNPIEFTNSSTDVSPTTTFTWDFGDGTPLQVYGPGNAGQTISHTYEKNTVSCETVVTLTAENYCSFGNPTSAQFQPLMIYDLDTAEITASATLLCYPDTVVHFTNTTVKNCVPEGNVAQRYEYWNFGNYWGTGSDSIIDWLPFDPPARGGYTLAFPGIGSYTVMMIDSNMCGPDTAFITVDIIAPPSADFTVSSDSLCVGEVFVASSLGGNGANQFLWDLGDGNGFQAGTGNETFTFSDSGNFTLTLISTITGGTLGCSDTNQLNIYVKPSPEAHFNLSELYGCDSLTTSISDSTTGAIAWSWDFGNGNTSNVPNPPQQTYTTSGVHSIELTVTHQNGCSDSETADVTVFVSPIAQFQATNVCVGKKAFFQDISTYCPLDVVTHWNWDFGEGAVSTDQNPDHLFATADSFLVQLSISTAHCSDSTQAYVTVEVTPSAVFNPDVDHGCSPLDITFSNNSLNAAAFYWDFGDGSFSVSNSPNHQYLNSDTVDTTFDVSLIASTTFGCADTIDTQIVVYSKPQAAFASNSTPQCAPVSTQFINLSRAASAYLWLFDDSTFSTVEDPVHTFNNNTQFIEVFDVEMVAINNHGCSDTAFESIMVFPEPNFTFSTIPDSGCSPLEVSFPAVMGAVSYVWDFGDGTTSTGQMPSHTYTNNSTNNQQFTVQLVGQSAFGCYDTTSEVVTVFPTPIAQYSLQDTAGCTPFNAQIINSSLNALDYRWYFGDGDTSSSNAPLVQHIYNNPGTDITSFPLSLVAVTDMGCTDSITHSVTVFPGLKAAFASNDRGCSPLNVEFVAATQNVETYLWDFGDGNISLQQNPTNVYYAAMNDTSYNCELKVTSIYGCTDSVSHPIDVLHTAFANIYSSTIYGCSPLDVTFFQNSVGFDSLLWVFGDGTAVTSMASQIDHQYQNSDVDVASIPTKIIAYTADGCNDTAEVAITVYPEVHADFESPDQGCSPFDADFINRSTNAHNYFWNFGNGNVSFAENPSETFHYQGNGDTLYFVELISSSMYNCSDTADTFVQLFPEPVANFLVDPLQQVYPNTIFNITNLTTGNWVQEWSKGEGWTIAGANPGSIDLDTVGEFQIGLHITNGICSDSTFKTVTVVPPPPVASFWGSGNGCAPLTISFENNSEWAKSYEWDFGDGNQSNIKEPVYTYYEPGVYSVRLKVKGDNGEHLIVKIDSVKVRENAIAQFEFHPATVSSTLDPVYFVNQSINADRYLWHFGDGGYSEQEFPEYQYSSPGIYEVKLIASNEFNCADTLTHITKVEVQHSGTVTFPNAFKPGLNGPNGGYYEEGSTDNHIFHPICHGVIEYHLAIYNRWGEMVFESQDPFIGWDGYYRNKLAPQDAYVWKAKVTFADGKEEVLVGDVTLIR
jgi:PKD repeat protein